MTTNSSALILPKNRGIFSQPRALDAIPNKRGVVANLLSGVISSTTAEWLPAADGPSEPRPQLNKINSEHRPSLPSPKLPVVSENGTISPHEVRPGIPRSNNTGPSATKQYNSTRDSFSKENHKSRSHDYAHEWMAKFCVEPPIDGATCALGVFLPCVLMGKTDWRLGQIEAHRDPLDSAWKTSYACNATCLGLAVAILAGESLGCVLLPGYAILQRFRVRNTYDIRSNSCEDCAIAYFCTRCSIIQVDREVRAREGEARLRTNKKFILEPVVTQPTRTEPMRYVSPRPMLECQVTVEELETSKEKGWITQVAMLKRRAALERLDSEEMASSSIAATHERESQSPEKVLQDKSNQSIELAKYPAPKVATPGNNSLNEMPVLTTLQRVSRDLKSSMSGRQKTAEYSVAEVERGSDTHKQGSKVKGEQSLRDCGAFTILESNAQEHHKLDPNSKMTTSTSNNAQIQGSKFKEEHSLIECGTYTIFEYKKQEDNLPNPQSKMTTSTSRDRQHSLLDCDMTDRSSIAVPEHDLGQYSTASARSSTAVPEHILIDCPRVSPPQSPAKVHHRLSTCVTVASEPTSYVHDFTDYPINRAVLEFYEKNPALSIYSKARHRLSSCMTTASDARSEGRVGAHAPELSYVHDFTDCPVDKAVLEYYEKEEKRVQEHQANCSAPDQECRNEHRLSSCPGIVDIPQRSSVRDDSESCCSMVAEIRRQRTRGHRVVSCPGATASPDKEVSRQHRIDSCPIFPSSGEISHRPSLTQFGKPRLDSRALPPIPSFDDSNATKKKGKGKGKEGETEDHIHTDHCLKDGLHSPKEGGRRRNSFNYAIDVLSTAVKSLQPRPDASSEDGSTTRKEKPKRRKIKGKGKVVEIKVTQTEKPRTDSAQAALERLLASSSQGAKREAVVKIEMAKKGQTMAVHTDVSPDAKNDVKPDVRTDAKAAAGEENVKQEKRPKTWGDTLGRIFGEARNSEIGS